VNVFNITVNVTVNVNFGDTLDRLRQPAQEAMADTYKGVVDANFGSVGWDRPWTWEALSPRYAKKVGRPFATLFVSGALKDSVSKESANPEAATVTMVKTSYVPYSLAHHYGYPENNLPARRVFPMNEDGTVTDRTARVVTQAARQAVKEALA
jgi:hypothetical protein